MPFSPLGRGVFADAPRTDHAALPFLHANPRFVEPNLSANLAIIDQLRRFAHGRGWSLSALALAWVLDQGDHLMPIPATRSPEHLREWAGACEITLTDEDRAEIARIMPPGWAHGDRYSDAQIVGIERYC